LEVQETVKLVASKHGHDIIVAATGAEAFAYVATSRPDIIVLDTVLSDVDG
jgi:DNA-binding response OmpR family regulator